MNAMDSMNKDPVSKSPPSRSFTWARIAALLVTIVLLTGLTYLGVSSSPETVSVSQGAHAGQLTMHPCTYPTENGAYRADCGTLVVPENRADPRSRLIALPVTRILARSSHPLGANLPSQRRPGHNQHDVSPSEPPGRPARCRHGRLPRHRRLFGAELSRGERGAGELRRLPRQSVAERVLPGLRLVRAAA